MRFYLLQMKVNGIKNIDKEIVLNFYNKTLKKTFEFNNSNIKSIYGSNGSGKSAIINAVDIYKNLILNGNYLSDSRSLRVLNELINKKNNKFSIELSFLYYNKDEFIRSDVVTHRIEVIRESRNNLRISYERIFINKGNKYDGTKGKVLIEIENGQFVKSDFESEYKEIEKYTLNLLDKHSIITVLSKHFFSNQSNERSYYLLNLLSPIALCFHLEVIMSNSDIHQNYLLMKDLEEFSNFFYEKLQYTYINTNTDFIDKKDFHQYKKNVCNLERFIKVFKSELICIDIDFKEDKDVFICNKYFNYGDYRIESEFESTGIKKLITLYNAFYDLNNGKIVFIDELDANLHDVYLCKLLEYFSIYAKGQLCFTTHNLTPMEILKKRNYSIDFLSDNSTITSWIKNGNYSVSKLYKEGMIDNSPFNIEAFDFIGLFDENE